MGDTRLYFLGIDAGKDGGLVLIDGWGRILNRWKPALVKSAMRADEYDVPGNLKILKGIAAEYAEADWDGCRILVVLEGLHAMPLKSKDGKQMGGSKGNFQRGYAFGLWEGLVASMGWSLQTPRPQTWQKIMFMGISGKDPKQRSVLAACRKWPDQDWKRESNSKVWDHGLTDAALLGEFGRLSAPIQS